MKIGTVPSYFDPGWAGELYTPRLDEAIRAGLAAGYSPAVEDPGDQKVAVFGVDPQYCFCAPPPVGTLYVEGAEQDMIRATELIYQIAPVVTKIFVSKDGHPVIWQIAFPWWWINQAGQHPDPGTIITLDDVQKGKWIPLIDRKGTIAYVEYLKAKKKDPIVIWPPHGHEGAVDAAIVSPVMEAFAYWAAARKGQVQMITKGVLAKSEHYDPLGPEMPIPGHPLGSVNTIVLDMLATFKYIITFGQAESHCVRMFLRGVTNYFANQPEVIESLYLVEDCTSPVVIPGGPDFKALCQPEYDKMVAQGMNVVTAAEVPGILGLS